MQCWHTWMMLGLVRWQLRTNRLGRRWGHGQLLLVRRNGRFNVLFDLGLGRLRASGLDQIGDPNPAVGGTGQPSLLILFPGTLAAANALVIYANTPTG
jgi:hypothetical protein